MGLFSKKLLPFPSKPSEKQEQINMDKLMADIPLPPSDFGNQPQLNPSPLPPPGTQQPFSLETPPLFSFDDMQKELPPIAAPPLPEKELPPIDFPPANLQLAAQPPSMSAPAPQQPPKETFDLPDFDDEEIKELEIIKPVVKQEPEKKIVYTEEIDYPGTERKSVKQKEKYLDVNCFMLIKDELEEMRKIASATEENIEQHTATTSEKNERYEALTESLNLIQEKIILIDTKLFESH